MTHYAAKYPEFLGLFCKKAPQTLGSFATKTYSFRDLLAVTTPYGRTPQISGSLLHKRDISRSSISQHGYFAVYPYWYVAVCPYFVLAVHWNFAVYPYLYFAVCPCLTSQILSRSSVSQHGYLAVYPYQYFAVRLYSSCAVHWNFATLIGVLQCAHVGILQL